MGFLRALGPKLVLYVVTPVCVSRLSPKGNITYCLRLRRGDRTIARPTVRDLLLFADGSPDEVIISTPYGTYQLSVGRRSVVLSKYSRESKSFKRVETHEQPCTVFPSYLPDGLGFVLVCKDGVRVFRVIEIRTGVARANKIRYDAVVKCVKDLMSSGSGKDVLVQTAETLTQYFDTVEVNNSQGFGVYSTVLSFAGVHQGLLEGHKEEEE